MRPQILSPHTSAAGSEQSFGHERAVSVIPQILSPHVSVGSLISEALGLPETSAPEANCPAASFENTP